MRDIRRDPKYKSDNAIPFAFHEGDWVIKNAGDYSFNGVVLVVFRKRSGSPRYIVENSDGVVHIFSAVQLSIDPALQCLAREGEAEWKNGWNNTMTDGGLTKSAVGGASTPGRTDGSGSPTSAISSNEGEAPGPSPLAAELAASASENESSSRRGGPSPEVAAEAALAYAIWDSENSTRIEAQSIQEHLARASSVIHWLEVHGHKIVPLSSGPSPEGMREALKRAEYYINRLEAAHRGRVVRDLDEACVLYESSRDRALSPSEGATLSSPDGTERK